MTMKAEGLQLTKHHILQHTSSYEFTIKCKVHIIQVFPLSTKS